MDLYAQLTRCRTLPVGRTSKLRPTLTDGVDILIVRENVEGFYIKQECLEETAWGRSAIALRRVTEANSRLLARCAFQQARKRRKLVAVAHKTNILTITDGLFRESCFAVAREFPDVTVEEYITEPFVCALISDPTQFDVVVTPNMFGDFISEALSMLVGGLQFQAQSNVGENFILAHPLHGTADDIEAGTANPGAMLRAVGLVAEFLLPNGARIAQLIDDALFGVLREGLVVPRDLGGSARTTEVTAAVVRRFETLLCSEPASSFDDPHPDCPPVPPPPDR
eukprot:TRINITY_DN5707_c0_g1_i1.p2 TRINITY_DN5707_c0_g1~~TRINITY_DN5707_c0_g1_i1.p2  ORF type:complete len:282 (+),score=94.12 TRINITY_DN5707_c0_g1_i1:232-1077(+)